MTIRPGSTVTHCNIVCKVASIYKGEAELTTPDGTRFIAYVPVGACHEVKEDNPRHRIRRGHSTGLQFMDRDTDKD